MARHSSRIRTIEDGESSRTKLLRAAEQRIVKHGAHSLTIRLIEADAGVNSSLIGYYFGGVEGLLTELYQMNFDLMLAERTRLLAAAFAGGRTPSAEEILEAFLRSLWHEAAHCKGERALAVIHEIFSSAPEALRLLAHEAMRGAFKPVAEALKHSLPHLDEATLLWRLSCLSGAMVTITPRGSAWEMYENLQGDPRSLTDEGWFQQMMDFAKGALLAEASVAASTARTKPVGRKAKIARDGKTARQAT
jgi:AcrR family transcriptional regulator